MKRVKEKWLVTFEVGSLTVSSYDAISAARAVERGLRESFWKLTSLGGKVIRIEKA